MKTETAERIETLDAAEEALVEAIALIEAAVKGSPEENRAEHYILPHLRSWLADSIGSSYCSIKDLRSAMVQDEPDPEDGVPVHREPTQAEVMDHVASMRDAGRECRELVQAEDGVPEHSAAELAHLEETESQDPGGYDESTNPSNGWEVPE